MDVPLTPEGHAEAEQGAMRFQGIQPSFIVSSDMARAKGTAMPISMVTQMPWHEDPRLRPWHMGQLTGMTKEDVDSALKYYLRQRDEQIPEGESFSQFAQRWSEAVGEYSNKARQMGAPGVLVTSHSNILTLPYVLYSTPPKSVTTGVPFPGDAVQLNEDGQLDYRDGGVQDTETE